MHLQNGIFGGSYCRAGMGWGGVLLVNIYIFSCPCLDYVTAKNGHCWNILHCRGKVTF